MHYYEVAPTRIIRSQSVAYTYRSASALQRGHIVSIEVGSRTYVGVVLRSVAKPSYATKDISTVIEKQPLPLALVDTAEWISRYYVTHLALVLQMLLPTGIQKTRRTSSSTIQSHISYRKRTNFVLNKEQIDAITTVTAAPEGTLLLHGVTGAGKTRVYIELAKQTIAAGKSVILLVPEIALTSQLVDEFSRHFSDILLTHSRQTEAQRHTVWREALTSTTPRVAIGPRSALFMPLASIGLIVIDEAHEPSFKQEQSPRYSALRVASILAKSHHTHVVLGSATPAISDYYLAERNKNSIITMSSRAAQAASASHVTTVDMTKRHNFKRHRFLSDTLLGALEQTFARDEQALIFHNRRGSTSTTLCKNCGWTALCPRCFIPFTLHADQHILACHICASQEKVPTSCPVCNQADIIHKGIGTKLIESELRTFFPKITIGRFDADSSLEESVDKKYPQLYDGTIQLIIGTQVIAKGLDLPKLRTVGVIQADAGLALPDYGASERTFQLLAQVVGRVGRTQHPTEVIVQSYQPTHPAVVYGLSQDYQAFYSSALKDRKRGNFPPFTFLLKLVCVYKTEAAAIRNAKQLAQTMRSISSEDVQILGPTPAFYERQHDTYRWQLILKSPKRQHLVDILSHVPPTHWQYELDPVSLL